MIDEELEQKVGRQSLKDLDAFLASLSPIEHAQLITINPQLFAKIWTAATDSTLTILKEISEAEKKDD
jgi:hypothetical protein